MNLPTGIKHFHIYDYFLDGRFLRWEEVHTSHLPVEGEMLELQGKDGKRISAKVAKMEPLSESECSVFLVSAE